MRIRGTAAAGAVLFSALSPTAASADPTSSAVCIARVVTDIPEGVTLTPKSLSFRTRPGPLDCFGTVRGDSVTGAGRFWDFGTIDGTCTAGLIRSTVFMVIPTTGGEVTLRLPIEATYVGVTGLRAANSTLPGGIVFVPTAGNCVTTPLTQASVVVHSALLT